MQTDEVEALQQLAAFSILSIVPSGDSDDAYILNYARDNNGYVISNDLFHDHLRSLEVQSVRSSMNVWLSEHRCGYAFISRQHFMFNPVSSLRPAIEECHDRHQEILARQQQKLDQDLHSTLITQQQQQRVCEQPIETYLEQHLPTYHLSSALRTAAPPSHLAIHPALSVLPPATATQTLIISNAAHDIPTPMSCTSDVTVGDAAPNGAYRDVVASVCEIIKQVRHLDYSLCVVECVTQLDCLCKAK